jgi:hypothetical protein
MNAPQAFAPRIAAGLPLRAAAFAALALALTAAPLPPARAATGPTWVGNGDDGSDLEGAEPLSKGPIVEARARAVSLARNLGLPGVRGLGDLLPELERSALFLARKDVTATLPSDQGRFHADLRGLVYARTFARPHAATRFFPVAKSLDSDQLVALHLHEALHRALPPAIREDESVVAEIALAIVAPDATRDGVEAVMSRRLPPEPVRDAAAEGPAGTSQQPAARVAPPRSNAARPSTFAYEYRNFLDHEEDTRLSQVLGMHVLSSELAPFGSGDTALGLGIEASLIRQPGRTVMGPLGLSGRLTLWSSRDFDVGVWGTASLNMLSAEELKNSKFGRDTLTAGLSLRKDFARGYVENRVGYTAEGSATRAVGAVSYDYTYGAIVQALVRAGGRVGPLQLGGYVDLNLADQYSVAGGAFSTDTGRYRLVSAGPEVTWNLGDFRITAHARTVLSSPDGVDFDSLGMLLGPGSGLTAVGVRASYHF